LARGLVEHAHKLAAFAADPAAAVEAGTQIGADAERTDLIEQGLLHPQLTAELDEGRNPVAQELGDGKARIERDIFRGGLVVGTRVARIATHARAGARHADLEKRLAEI